MKLFQNTHLLSFVTVVLIFVFVTGCGTSDDHGETPVGLVMSVNGNVLATQDGTTVTYATGDQISLTQGVPLGPILVEFLAEDGDRYLPDSNDGYSLKFSTANSNMISLTPVSGANAWTIQLTGAMAGNTTMTIELMHNGHADFESRPFQVRVVAN